MSKMEIFELIALCYCIACTYFGCLKMFHDAFIK